MKISFFAVKYIFFQKIITLFLFSVYFYTDIRLLINL